MWLETESHYQSDQVADLSGNYRASSEVGSVAQVGEEKHHTKRDEWANRS